MGQGRGHPSGELFRQGECLGLRPLGVETPGGDNNRESAVFPEWW